MFDSPYLYTIRSASLPWIEGKAGPWQTPSCAEDDRHQPEGNPGGGEEVEEAVIGSPPENPTGPPVSTIDVAQLPPSWLVGQTGPLWQQMLSLLEEVWQEDWLLELAFLQGGQEEVCPAAA